MNGIKKLNVRNYGQLGEKNHSAKLTEQKVIDIRKKYKEGSTYQKLADEYGVGISCIFNAVSYITWPHLD